MGFRADVFFASRWFVMVHILEIILILLIAGLVFGRLTISNPPVTRSDLLGLIMGIKSLFFIAYQLLTQHTRKFARFASLRVNKIMNLMEPVFWFVVIILAAMAVDKRCIGTACTLSALVMVAAIPMVLLAIWTAVCSWRMRREEKMGLRATTGPAFARSTQTAVK